MRWLTTACLATLVLIVAAPALAAEQGVIIRAGELMAQPFLDAAKAGPVTPNQSVTILERRGGWIRVESGGRTGWVRMLNVRFASAGVARTGGGGIGSLLRTGSSGKTVTTGVKGIGEEDIRKAAPDYAALLALDGLGVDAAQARANAQKEALRETPVEYLDVKGKAKGKDKAKKDAAK